MGAGSVGPPGESVDGGVMTGRIVDKDSGKRRVRNSVDD